MGPPQPKTGGSGGSAPQPKFFSKKRKKNKKYFIFFSRYLPHGTLLFSLKVINKRCSKVRWEMEWRTSGKNDGPTFEGGWVEQLDEGALFFKNRSTVSP